MLRHQRGHIVEKFGAFHVRFYVTEIVDGKPRRVQRSKRLCAKDRVHYSTSCKPVRLLAEDHMRDINAQVVGHVNTRDIAVCEFWNDTYLPFATKNLKPATVYGYEQIWGQHLQPHFGSLTLKEYRTHFGSRFLTGLADALGRNTLQHIRSLASGVFSHALNLGLIESNPWHDVKVLGKTKEPGATAHYTLEEAENIISALVDRVDCQLVVALSFFLGLRPGEIQGLRWDDFDAEWVHIRRAVGRGVVGLPKTKRSVRSVPLITPVRVPLELWRQRSGGDGWVFSNGAGNPLDLARLTREVIRPTLAAKGIAWKTLYAGRRGNATALTELTGDPLAAKEVLGHTNVKVTEAHYIGAMPAVGMRGMKLLEEAATKK